MKYIDEFRDVQRAQRLIGHIREQIGRPIHLMEFCGGHTHAIFRFGLRQMLTPQVQMHAGPGCPVCVTAATDLDRVIALADLPNVIVVTFGDIVRVPGTRGTLLDARGRGADVRIVYSALDGLEIARQNSARPVVFLGIGFETTAPTIAAAVMQAEQESLDNFSVLSLHKLTPPAMCAILDAGEIALDGIIGPGHVSAVIGYDAWQFLADRYGIACAVAGFEPLDILAAVAALVQCQRSHQARVLNTYARGVRPAGNQNAQRIMERVFEVEDAAWRGFGVIPRSGLAIRAELAHRDAGKLFRLDVVPTHEPAGCRCGEVLRGILEPKECPLFRHVCSPRSPIGPCMVSGEGACAAYYQYAGELV